VLASTHVVWPTVHDLRLSDPERRILSWGSRPWQSVMRPVRGGAFFVDATAPIVRVDTFLRLEAYWSDRLWQAAGRDPDWLHRAVGHARGSLAA